MPTGQPDGSKSLRFPGLYQVDKTNQYTFPMESLITDEFWRRDSNCGMCKNGIPTHVEIR